MKRTLIACALVALFLGGCGRGGDSQSEPGSNLPHCSAIWVNGKTLPKTYSGCLLASGSPETFNKAGSACTDGSFLVVFGTAFWANTGSPVHHSGWADDPAYGDAYMAC